MPELPEVETLRRDAERYLLGRRIEAVDLLAPEVVRLPAPAAFREGLAGAAFIGARRRAKYLLLDLDNGCVLALQLALFGQFLLVDSAAPPDAGRGATEPGRVGRAEPDPDTLLVLTLTDGAFLQVLDRSRYTRLYLGSPAELSAALRLDTLGPEPLDPAFTVEALAALLRGRRGRLKALLLDQHMIAGLGNIYADEALWRARLHPGRVAGSLTADETAALHDAIQGVLREAIANRGTTFHTYRDLLGAKGGHQEHLVAFHRQGAPCPRCGTPVERVTLASRDTHLCPACQVLDAPGQHGDESKAGHRGRRQPAGSARRPLRE
ncbi:MAG TPA: bifunctional DNA-formamidopyrimidine glycosylase/DNA-(apurinic or apyrimidinic site) lyase [Chloroflexota bacterium]|nr:bifunctional DNA-formamidopyrimidine glycosylase/DNA-(apurinic or apyrimidinic site) lyase [Chloroflexota bacterium]